MIWLGFSAILFLGVGFLILYRVPVCGTNNSLHTSLPKTSIIIPARNEQYNLPNLLGSLKTQTLVPDEIIVVDDGSEDSTARIALEYKARVITSSSLPKGWLGKPWSCYQGAQEAQGDIFVFLDADTFLEESGFERIIKTFLAEQGAISVFPYHMPQKFHEHFSAFFNLVQLIGMRSFSLLKKRESAGMFGPCLVISRKDYVKSGGHKAVSGEILEHYALADILKKHRIPIRLFSGKGSLNMRMYPEGWKDLIQGWTKSLTSGAGKTPLLIMHLSIMWITGLLITAFFLLFSLFSGKINQFYFWATTYILYICQLYIQFRRAGHFPLWSAIFYPVTLAFFLGVFSWAVYRTSRKKRISWKGRNIKKNMKRRVNNA
jgi:4,4'-diaponeurosporenoate glycosyltransferase